jgi:hypothetical protein
VLVQTITHQAAALGNVVIATLPTAGTSGGFQALLLHCDAGGRPAGVAAASLPGDVDLAAAAVVTTMPAGGPSPLLLRCCCSLSRAGPKDPAARPADTGDAARCRERSGVVSGPRRCRVGCGSVANTRQQDKGLARCFTRHGRTVLPHQQLHPAADRLTGK